MTMRSPGYACRPSFAEPRGRALCEPSAAEPTVEITEMFNFWAAGYSREGRLLVALPKVLLAHLFGTYANHAELQFMDVKSWIFITTETQLQYTTTISLSSIFTDDLH